jgi:hypothetical protein
MGFRFSRSSGSIVLGADNCKYKDIFICGPTPYPMTRQAVPKLAVSRRVSTPALWKAVAQRELTSQS